MIDWRDWRDWAGVEASRTLERCNLIAYTNDDLNIIAAALRKAREDALEEAARAVTEKFKAESELCAADLTAAIRALKEKTP
jgi:glutamyl-tRNA reductase